MLAYQPEALHRILVEAFNRADSEALADLYEANAILMTKAGKAIGRDAIREAYREMLTGGGRMELQTIAILASTDGLALLHSSWTIHHDGTGTSGVSTEVVRRQGDGNWLFVLDEPRTPAIASV